MATQQGSKKRKRTRAKPKAVAKSALADGAEEIAPSLVSVADEPAPQEPTPEQADQEEERGENDQEDNEEVGREVKKLKIPEELKRQLAYKNRERVLVFCSRGITNKERLLMNDLRRLLPHSKKEGKFDGKNQLGEIPTICEMKNCNNCIFFESRKRKDLYLWMCKTPKGPGCKFLVTGVHPMSDLRLTGNCLKGSRPLLSFSKHFDLQPQYQLVKELLVQIFTTPKGHKKSKPFVDHIMMFSIQGGQIWFRHYQILENEHKGTHELVEIGPRFVMQLIRIFDGCFGGQTLYKNPDFVNPNKVRATRAKKFSGKYAKRVAEKKQKEQRDSDLFKDMPVDNRDDLFNA